MTIQPPTINNIKTIYIKNKILEPYNDNDDNNSIKSLASSVIKSNRNNKTIKIDFTTHSKTLKKKNFPKA